MNYLKKIPFTTTSQSIIYLGINLTKKVKDLYTLYKTLMKEIEGNTNKWKGTLCLWIGRNNSYNFTYSQKQSRFNVIPIKIAVAPSTEVEKTLLKYVWKQRKLQITKAFLRRKNKAEGITLPKFKMY